MHNLYILFKLYIHVSEKYNYSIALFFLVFFSMIYICIIDIDVSFISVSLILMTGYISKIFFEL